jgi:hypothetical protein
MNRNLIGVCIAGMVLSTLLFPTAPKAADDLPTVDQVIKQHVDALGGRTALEKHSTLVLSGNCEASVPDESGPVEILVRTPQVAFNLGKGGLQQGFTGTTVWRHAANEALQQRSGRQYAELVTVFDPARVLSWKEWYPEIAVTGIEKVDGREAYVIETHPGTATSERILIDRQSGLLVRDEVMPGVVFTFSDYRAVDAIQIPFMIQQTAPSGLTYIFRFAEVKHREATDDSLFQPR